MSVVHGGFRVAGGSIGRVVSTGLLRRLAGYVMIALHRMFR
jgi:hypothetical protein